MSIKTLADRGIAFADAIPDSLVLLIARLVTSVNECKFGCGLRWPLVSSPVG